MTIKIQVECDALGCSNEREIEEAHDAEIESMGWHIDPHDGWTHYCNHCWPKIEKEFENS